MLSSSLFQNKMRYQMRQCWKCKNSVQVMVIITLEYGYETFKVSI